MAATRKHCKIKVINGVREKQCTCCGFWWPDTKAFFYRSKGKKSPLGSQCRSCLLRKKTDWYWKNRIHCMDRQRMYYKIVVKPQREATNGIA